MPKNLVRPPRAVARPVDTGSLRYWAGTLTAIGLILLVAGMVVGTKLLLAGEYYAAGYVWGSAVVTTVILLALAEIAKGIVRLLEDR